MRGCQEVEDEDEEGRVDRRGVRSRGSEGESCRWGGRAARAYVVEQDEASWSGTRYEVA